MTPIKHDYNGITINQRPEDGYINLNEMAQATSKRVDNWLQNKSTQELIAEFNLEPSLNSRKATALITDPTNAKFGGGTWAHPDIAIQFAQWCSPSFAIQVSRWVREWFSGANAFTQMDYDQLALEEIDADISTFKATIKRTQAKLEKKLRERDWVLEKIKHKQLELEMGTDADDNDLGEINVSAHTRRRNK
jgi:hypothetical protein